MRKSLLHVRSIPLVIVAFGVVLLAGCPGEIPEEGVGASAGQSTSSGDPYDSLELKTIAEGETPTVAYVTNGIDPFWSLAEAGVVAGGKDYDCNVEVRMPPDGVADQQRMIEELLVMGVNGIAISPIDAENQASFINDIAESTNVITHDADAPASDRICYIGMSNYDAGRMCGELVKEEIGRAHV